MDPVVYEKAKKTAQTVKKRDNYIVVRISYEASLILPYKEGLAFIQAMGGAEQLSTTYNKPHRIQSIDPELLKVGVMSPEDYDRYKIAALLNVTIDDLKLYEEQQLTTA